MEWFGRDMSRINAHQSIINQIWRFNCLVPLISVHICIYISPWLSSIYLGMITLTTICIWSPWQPSEGPLPRRTSLVQVQGNRGCEPSKERLFTFDSIIGFSKAGRKNFRGIFQLIRNSPAPKTPSGSFECFGLLFQSLIQPSEEYFLWDDKDKEGVSL